MPVETPVLLVFGVLSARATAVEGHSLPQPVVPQACSPLLSVETDSPRHGHQGALQCVVTEWVQRALVIHGNPVGEVIPVDELWVCNGCGKVKN